MRVIIARNDKKHKKNCHCEERSNLVANALAQYMDIVYSDEIAALSLATTKRERLGCPVVYWGPGKADERTALPAIEAAYLSAAHE
jgi:hypothetical protein